MFIEIIVLLISIGLSLYFGIIIGSNNIMPPTFYEVTFYQVVQLVLTVIIGVFFAYYLNHRNSKDSKKKEYIIKQCNELDDHLEENTTNIYTALSDFSDVNKRNQILLYLKIINSKLGIIIKLNQFKKMIALDYYQNQFDEYKDRITGDEMGTKTTFDDVSLAKFKKDEKTLRSALQNMIADCLNK